MGLVSFKPEALGLSPKHTGIKSMKRGNENVHWLQQARDGASKFDLVGKKALGLNVVKMAVPSLEGSWALRWHCLTPLICPPCSCSANSHSLPSFAVPQGTPK